MDKQKRWLFSFGKLVTMPTLFLLMLFAGSTTAYATEYELYIGNTKVTDTNKGDILGDGKASYDPGTATLTLNGVNIGADAYHTAENTDDYETYNYSLYSGTDVVKHLVITGNNTFVSKASGRNKNGGIYFSVSGPIDAGPPYGSSDPKYYAYIYYSLIITGTGTLTSTATEGDMGTAMTVAGVANENTGYEGGFIMGNGTPADKGLWNGDGTGPTLKLTGWDTGADFRSTGRFHMHGGTIIAEAKNPTAGTGVYLADGMGNFNYFEGGTTAGYGNEAFSIGYEGAGGLDPDSDTATKKVKEHGMRLVYPETGDDYIQDGISGWCVVGMTAEGFKDKTDAVLVQLGLKERTDPLAGENGSYHTDTLPDPGVYFDVQGYTKAATVYSVDVEWGAMTFEYEASSWNPVSHKTERGDGWRVYDSTTGKAVADAQADINKVTVTNHSNAPVYASLSYTGNESYTDIGGGFTKKDSDTVTDFTAASGDIPDYLTLATADNNKADAAAGQGEETVGTVYFMPSGIGRTSDTINNIAKWTKIGKITVGIRTEQPK